MSRLSRLLAAALSLSLAASAPGQAYAQMIGARSAPAASAGAAGAAVHAVGGLTLTLPAASLQTGLTPSLLPTAAFAPVLAAPSVAVAAPVASQPIAAPVAAVSETKAPPRALALLQGGGTALSAASKTGAPDSPRVALDGLFEGAEARPEALAVSVLPAASDSPRLDQSSPRGPPKGPRWVKTLAPDTGPRTSLKRTFAVGYLAALVPMIVTYGAYFAAALTGYEFHPNYHGPPTVAVTTVASSLALWVGAAVMAPVAEEAMFRGFLQGRLAKLTSWLHLGNYILPTVASSLLFVALHETSDPVLMGTRLLQALILSRVYAKEGVLASMAAHGFFNGLFGLSIVFDALGAPWLGTVAILPGLWYAYKSVKLLRAQRPARESGELVPKRLTGPLALAFSAMLVLAYFMLMPNLYWAAGAVVLFVGGAIKMRNNQ